MKKHGLFKILLLLILLVGILSWVIPASYFDGSAMVDIGRYRVGFFDYFQFFFLTFEFQAFIQIFLYILSVGALYAVLSKTGKYRIIIEKFAKKLKGKELLFLLSTAFLIAACTSVFGFSILTFIIMPLLVAIILSIGYDKITAMLVICVPVLIGIIGGTLGSYTVGVINETLSTTISTGLYTKIGLFVITFAIYSVFLTKYVAKLNKKEVSEENAEQIDKLLGESKPIKKSSWPIYVIMGLLFTLTLVGCINWTEIFGIKLFTNLNTAITGFTIGENTIFAYILGNISELGAWYYAEITTLCIIASVIIGFSYKLKFNEILDAMISGIKKVVGTAFLSTLAFIVVYTCANMPFINTIINGMTLFVANHSVLYISIIFALLLIGILFTTDYLLINKSKVDKKKVIGITIGIVALFFIIYLSFGMNFVSRLVVAVADGVKSYSVFMTSLMVTISSLLHVDLTYLVYVLPVITTTFTGEAAVASLAIATQAFYGVTMLVAPTSIMMIIGLTYLNIPYKKWLKVIWKLALILYVAILILLIISHYL